MKVYLIFSKQDYGHLTPAVLIGIAIFDRGKASWLSRYGLIACPSLDYTGSEQVAIMRYCDRNVHLIFAQGLVDMKWGDPFDPKSFASYITVPDGQVESHVTINNLTNGAGIPCSSGY